MKMTEKLDRLMEERGLNKKQLSLQAEIPYMTVISFYEKGTENIKLSTLKKLAAFFCVSLDYLTDDAVTDREYGRPTEFRASLAEEAHIKKYRVLDLHGKDMVDTVLDGEYKRMITFDRAHAEQKNNITYLMCYDLAVSAGIGEPLGSTYYKQRIEVPTEFVPHEAHYCVRVNGDSMEPLYNDGDIVFVQKLETSVRVGEIGIFVLNGEGFLKRLGEGELISLNRRYAPIAIGEFDDLRCQGRVLGKVQ